MSKSIKRGMLILLSATLIMVNFIPVSAAENQMETTMDSVEIRGELLDIGVKEDKVDALVRKVERGQQLDSMKEKYKDLEPVETEWVDKNKYIERYEYPDGSVKEMALSGGILTGKISGGSKTNGTYWYTWNGAKISASWGIVTASYKADFQGATGASSIDRVYSKSITILGGVFSQESLKVNRPTGTSTSPALATLYFKGVATQDFGSSTFYLRLYVPTSGEAYAKFSV